MLSIEIKGVRSNSGFSGLTDSDAREPQGRARKEREIDLATHKCMSSAVTCNLTHFKQRLGTLFCGFYFCLFPQVQASTRLQKG